MLFLNGDSAKTRLQMLLPLALTDEDVPNGTCSVYAVLEVWKLPGEDVCDKSKTGWLIDGPNRDILYSRRASQRNIL